MKNPFHIMLIPTLGCPSKCSYCWSSEEASPIMSIETIREVVAWLKNFRQDRITFTFHGGEPLLAGRSFTGRHSRCSLMDCTISILNLPCRPISGG